MEEKHASNHNGAVSWFMRASRLAVAVAIIKSRPSEGVRRFTESLAETVKQQDKSWRCKARALQEDLLRLRQQLHLTHLLLKAERRVRPAAGHEVVGQLSQDDTQRLQEEGQSDSGCVVDISSHGTQGLCLPLTPPNGQNVLVQGREWCQDCGLVKHMQFLQCLSGLRRRYEPSLCVGDDDDVVWDSVVQLLDCVLEVFRRAHVGQAVHHPELLRHAAQVVEQTLSQRTADVQHFSRVEDLLKEMICLLLTGHQLNEFSVKGLLSECLMTLGGSRVIRPALVKLLMSQMIQMAQHLWDACQTCRDHQVDWIRHENSFYVFWLLEHLATDTDNHMDQELITQLENGAFALSDEFPLFSLYMWRIGGLFKTAHTRADSRPQPVVPNQTECS